MRRLQGQSYELLGAKERLAILEALMHVAADSETLRRHIQKTSPEVATPSHGAITQIHIASVAACALSYFLVVLANVWLCKVVSEYLLHHQLPSSAPGGVWWAEAGCGAGPAGHRWRRQQVFPDGSGPARRPPLRRTAPGGPHVVPRDRLWLKDKLRMAVTAKQILKTKLP